MRLAILVKLDKIPYVVYPTIRFNDKESVEMPFRECLSFSLFE